MQRFKYEKSVRSCFRNIPPRLPGRSNIGEKKKKYIKQEVPLRIERKQKLQLLYIGRTYKSNRLTFPISRLKTAVFTLQVRPHFHYKNETFFFFYT